MLKQVKKTDDTNITDPNKIYAGTDLVLKADDDTSPTKLGDMSGGEKVNYTYNGTPTALPTTNTTSWDKTEKGSAALGTKDSAWNALNSYGDFNFSQQDWFNQILEDIKGYKDFSYDMNGDALYQQYKDKYIQQGKLAMMDTMGQAAAMNGGYGSSYAQSVGQQAYQASLDNLNDIIPELYQMAYDRWSDGKQDLYNQYGMLSNERQNEYGMHQDGYDKLLDAYDIASDDYYRGGEMYLTEQDMQNEELWNQRNAAEDLRRYGNSEYWANESRKQYEEAKASGSNQGLQHVTAMSSQEIVEAMQSYKDDGDDEGLNSFLADCVMTGRMTEEQADKYFERYRTKKDDDVVDTTVQPIVPNVTGNRVAGGGGGGGGRFVEIAHK